MVIGVKTGDRFVVIRQQTPLLGVDVLARKCGLCNHQPSLGNEIFVVHIVKLSEFTALAWVSAVASRLH